MTRATKTLIVLGTGPDPSIYPQIVSGSLPRPDYLELARLLDADIASFREASVNRGRLFTRLFGKHPILGSAVSAFLRRKSYTHMYTPGEDIGLPLALLLRVSRWPGKHTMFFHKCISRRRRGLFRLLGPDAFARLVCASEAQKTILVNELGFPQHKVTSVLHSIDERFFTAVPDPLAAAQTEEDYIFSCGLENRNYPLLCQAAAQLSYRFRIAASGFMSMSGFQDAARPAIPPNMTLEPRLSFDELKQRYARARFIVVPVNDVPYAAGVTGLVEAMAMGKAVIVTASAGIAEYIRRGVSALVAPANDPAALADAIRTLWDDPARCAEMGRANRLWVESAMRLDLYCAIMSKIIVGAEASG